MNSTRFFGAFLVSLVLTTSVAGACGGDGDGDAGGDDNGGAEGPTFGGLQSEVVAPAGNADAIAFAPDGRLFFVEHWSGDIKIVTPEGELLPEPFAHLDDVAANILVGASGIAIDPEFESNRYVYVIYSRVDPGPPQTSRPAIVRFTDSGNEGTERTYIATDFPEINQVRAFNANGSIHFGPDGFLYAALGDYDFTMEEGPTGLPLAQELGTIIGKMIRIDKADGSAAPDNPLADDPAADPRIFALGFRVPFNFVFHPETERIYGSDNSGNSCEEVNIVEAGQNYGWLQAPETTSTDCRSLAGVPPIHAPAREGFRPEDFGSTVGVSGIEFISGSVYPVLGDSLVFCESGTQLLRRIVLTPPNFDQVTADDIIARDCWLDVTVGPDGLIYYSNLTEIRRLLPPPETPTPARESPGGEGSPAEEQSPAAQ
jgi:aldose sugar dehydrogenase